VARVLDRAVQPSEKERLRTAREFRDALFGALEETGDGC
jgi:hypothetical protein